MQILARLYDHVLAERRRVLTIVCATSGDTGGAAVEAFAGRTDTPASWPCFPRAGSRRCSGVS